MDTNAPTEVAPEPKRKGRVWRFLLRGLLALVVLAIVAHFVWKYSGSNQWERVGQRNGITVYSLKTPGTTIKKFKATWTIHSKLARLVAWVGDHNRSVHPMGLYDLRILEQKDERESWSAYKQPIVSFLRPREFVIKTDFSQDPKTKTLFYNVTGYPDRIPPNDCCVRVRTMSNRWTLVPQPGGALNVEWFVNMDLGGAVPYFLQNSVMPDGMFTFAPKVESFMERPEYKNASYPWLQEGPQ